MKKLKEFLGKYGFNIASTKNKKINFSSKKYWIERYKSGGNSGLGSYDVLAEYKADVLNKFLNQENIKNVIEFGCGDGNQIKYIDYPDYIGFDLSDDSLSICKKIFINDDSKKFKIMDDYKNETCDLSLSLDVIYHIVEYNVFEDYMNRLFFSSNRFVIIYSTDENIAYNLEHTPHIKHRKFTKWIEENKKDWQLLKVLPNKYKPELTGANFFIYGII